MAELSGSLSLRARLDAARLLEANRHSARKGEARSTRGPGARQTSEGSAYGPAQPCGSPPRRRIIEREARFDATKEARMGLENSAVGRSPGSTPQRAPAPGGPFHSGGSPIGGGTVLIAFLNVSKICSTFGQSLSAGQPGGSSPGLLSAHVPTHVLKIGDVNTRDIDYVVYIGVNAPSVRRGSGQTRNHDPHPSKAAARRLRTTM